MTEAVKQRPAYMRAQTAWSWSAIVAECEGDHEQALEQLAVQNGLGSYEDDVHSRASLRGPRRPAAEDAS